MPFDDIVEVRVSEGTMELHIYHFSFLGWSSATRPKHLRLRMGSHDEFEQWRAALAPKITTTPGSRGGVAASSLTQTGYSRRRPQSLHSSTSSSDLVRRGSFPSASVAIPLQGTAAEQEASAAEGERLDIPDAFNSAAFEANMATYLARTESSFSSSEPNLFYERARDELGDAPTATPPEPTTPRLELDQVQQTVHFATSVPPSPSPQPPATPSSSPTQRLRQRL